MNSSADKIVNQIIEESGPLMIDYLTIEACPFRNGLCKQQWIRSDKHSENQVADSNREPNFHHVKQRLVQRVLIHVGFERITRQWPS